MELLSITSIIIPEYRIRRQFDHEALRELGASIWSKGLLHPLVVRNDGRTLVAGERRLRAIQLLEGQFYCDGQLVPIGFAPVIRLGDLEALSVEEAELEENVVRKDITLSERAAAVKRLFDLRKKQNGTFTPKQTAQEVFKEEKPSDRKQQEIRDLLTIAEHLERPGVRESKNTTDALRAIRQSLDRENRSNLARNTGSTSARHTLIKGDALLELPKLPASSFTCIITDPIYGVDADQFGTQAAARHTYSDSEGEFREHAHALSSEGFRISTPKAHLYCFCDIKRFKLLADILALDGWRVWDTPLIWSKGGGMLPSPEYGPRRAYEAILYARKGQKQVNFVASDVIAIPHLQTPRRGGEKPWQLYMELLKRSTVPGDLILDPFAGCGPVFTAANRLQLVATGIEIDEEAQGMCLEAMEVKPEAGPLEVD